MKTPLTKIIAFCGDNPRGDFKLVSDYANALINEEQDHIIEAYLTGKKLSDGNRHAPNASKDLAYQYYSQTFKNK